MILRNYQIVIEARNGFVLPDYVPSRFGCSVSAPSAFNTVHPKGLTFTNENGHILNDHPVFLHRFNFVNELPGTPPEQAEVDRLVWSLLIAANITPGQVNVKITYLNTDSV